MQSVIRAMNRVIHYLPRDPNSVHKLVPVAGESRNSREGVAKVPNKGWCADQKSHHVSNLSVQQLNTGCVACSFGLNERMPYLGIWLIISTRLSLTDLY